MKITVLLADDHKMVRQALGAVLAQEPDIDVVAFASDGDEAITLAQAWKPDVVLLDICMPGTNGITAAARIAKLLPRVRIVALSAQSEQALLMQIIEAGVHGYVRKEESVSQLADVIRAVRAGRTCLPELPQPAGGLEKRLLSGREALVLRELAAGKPVRRIAESLEISTKTVDTYRRRIMNKLGLQSQTELMRYAVALHGVEPLQRS
jgi:DNA-binding NarL/FixJ family response regulator